MNLKAFFASLLTEDDANKVPDLARICWFAAGVISVVGILLFLVLSLFAVFGLGKFDHIAYGTGFGAVLAGFAALMTAGGAALAMKTKSGA